MTMYQRCGPLVTMLIFMVLVSASQAHADQQIMGEGVCMASTASLELSKIASDFPMDGRVQAIKSLHDGMCVRIRNGFDVRYATAIYNLIADILDAVWLAPSLEERNRRVDAAVAELNSKAEVLGAPRQDGGIGLYEHE